MPHAARRGRDTGPRVSPAEGRSSHRQPCHWLAKRSGTMPSIRTARRNGCCPHERRTTAPPRRSLAARARPPAEGRSSQGQPSARTVAACKGRVVSALGARTACWPHAEHGVRGHTFASASAACSPSIFVLLADAAHLKLGAGCSLLLKTRPQQCCCFFRSPSRARRGASRSVWCLGARRTCRRGSSSSAGAPQAGCRPMAPVGSRSSESLPKGACLRATPRRRNRREVSRGKIDTRRVRRLGNTVQAGAIEPRPSST